MLLDRLAVSKGLAFRLLAFRTFATQLWLSPSASPDSAISCNHAIHSIHREQLRFDGLAVGLKRRLHRVLLRVIRVTLLVSASLDSLLLALLAMGGPPCGVSLAHVLGELLGRDALYSIDFFEDGVSSLPLDIASAFAA